MESSRERRLAAFALCIKPCFRPAGGVEGSHWQRGAGHQRHQHNSLPSCLQEEIEAAIGSAVQGTAASLHSILACDSQGNSPEGDGAVRTGGKENSLDLAGPTRWNLY